MGELPLDIHHRAEDLGAAFCDDIARYGAIVYDDKIAEAPKAFLHLGGAVVMSGVGEITRLDQLFLIEILTQLLDGALVRMPLKKCHHARIADQFLKFCALSNQPFCKLLKLCGFAGPVCSFNDDQFAHVSVPPEYSYTMIS